MTDNIKLYGIQLLLKWLETPSYTNPDKKNLETIRSIAALKELIMFSLDVNADRVSSLIVLMILKEDLGERTTEKIKLSVKTAANDTFWGRAYKEFNNEKVYNMTKKYGEYRYI